MDFFQLIIAIISMVATVFAAIFTYLSFIKNNNSNHQNTEKNFNSKNHYERNINSKNNYEQHQHYYYETKNNYLASNNSTSNDGAELFIGGLIAFVVYAIILYKYLQYQYIVINSFVTIIAVGTLVSVLIVLLKKHSLQVKNRIVLLSSWLFLVIPISFLKFSFFSSNEFRAVIDTILNSGGKGVVLIVWNLFDTNKYDILYITFQVLSLILMLLLIFIILMYAYRNVKCNVSESYNKKFLSAYIVNYFFVLLFSTGFLAKLISMLQNLSGTIKL